MTEELNDQMQVRRQKLQELRDLGSIHSVRSLSVLELRKR